MAVERRCGRQRRARPGHGHAQPPVRPRPHARRGRGRGPGVLAPCSRTATRSSVVDVAGGRRPVARPPGARGPDRPQRPAGAGQARLDRRGAVRRARHPGRQLRPGRCHPRPHRRRAGGTGAASSGASPPSTTCCAPGRDRWRRRPSPPGGPAAPGPPAGAAGPAGRGAVVGPGRPGAWPSEPLLDARTLGRGWRPVPMVNNAEQRSTPSGRRSGLRASSAAARAAGGSPRSTRAGPGAARPAARWRCSAVEVVRRRRPRRAHRAAWREHGEASLDATWRERWAERDQAPGWIEARWLADVRTRTDLRRGRRRRSTGSGSRTTPIPPARARSPSTSTSRCGPAGARHADGAPRPRRSTSTLGAVADAPGRVGSGGPARRTGGPVDPVGSSGGQSKMRARRRGCA